MKFSSYIAIRILLRPLGRQRRQKILDRLYPYRNWIEPEVAHKISKTKGKLFIDIGANKGLYSILASKRFSQVLACEPDAENVNHIKKEIESRKITNITVLQSAVSNQIGTADMGRHSISEDRSTFSIMPTFKTPSAEIAIAPLLKVNTTTLNEIVEKVGCPADLIKVDVEGAEWLVLEGAQPVMNKVKSWIIELHDADLRSKLHDYLTSYDYQVEWVDDRHIYAVKKLNDKYCN